MGTPRLAQPLPAHCPSFFSGTGDLVLHGQPNGAKLAMSIAFALPVFERGSGPFCMASQRELSLPRALCLRLIDSPVSAPEACVRSAVLAQYLLVIQSHARRGG